MKSNDSNENEMMWDNYKWTEKTIPPDYIFNDDYALCENRCWTGRGFTDTNNHAEQMIRLGVLWRKCSQGTSSDKGNRWVERIRSLRQTCRLRSLKTYPILVDAVQRYFRGQETNTAWI